VFKINNPTALSVFENRYPSFSVSTLLDGELDATFGLNRNGIVLTDIKDGSNDVATSMHIDPTSGNIYVAGRTTADSKSEGGPPDNFNFAIVRYTKNGELDANFGENGILSIDIDESDDRANSMQIDPLTGDVYVAGTTSAVEDEDRDIGPARNFVIVKYNAEDGDLDDGFGTEGKVLTNINNDDDATSIHLRLDPDNGYIYVAGTTGPTTSRSFVIVRYTRGGNLDTGFGTDGILTIGSIVGDVSTASMQLDLTSGDIYVAGTTGPTTFSLIKYDKDGNLDTGFGPDGDGIAKFPNIVVTSIKYLIQLDHINEYIYVAGKFTSSSSFEIVRFRKIGELDENFGENGILSIDITDGSVDTVKSLQLDPINNYIYAAGTTDAQSADGTGGIGSTTNFVIVRYKDDGSIDTGFGPDGNGKVVTANDGSNDDVSSMQLDPNNEYIYVAGTTGPTGSRDFVLVRYIARTLKKIEKSTSIKFASN